MNDWVVLRMIEGCAMQAAFGLSLGGRQAYCPVLRVKVQGRGAARRERVVRAFPMLPGYLFARLQRDDDVALMGGPRIRYSVMSRRGEWQYVRTEQMAVVRDREEFENRELVPRPLQPGDTVRMIHGLLTGDVFKVVALRRRRGVMVPLVARPGHTRSFEVDADDVEIARA